MTSALAIIPAARFIEQPQALVIQDASYDQWLARGIELEAQYNKIKWHILDWMAWGFYNLGEDFWQGVSDMGYIKNTIDNYLRIHWS